MTGLQIFMIGKVTVTSLIILTIIMFTFFITSCRNDADREKIFWIFGLITLAMASSLYYMWCSYGKF